ncbi:MAG: hypothetical protein M3137_05430 [Actinomycetota bacterium]|nr:hypothetical protein [Actinomycetota bacterium]
MLLATVILVVIVWPHETIVAACAAEAHPKALPNSATADAILNRLTIFRTFPPG